MMKKTIRCASCATPYNIDLDKYGGKKIKCKNCQGVIAVPATGDDPLDSPDEATENAKDRANVPPTPHPESTGIPSGILDRHRTASAGEP